MDRPPWYQRFLPIQNPALAYAVMAIAALMVLGGLWVILKKDQSPEPSGLYAAVLKTGQTRGGGPENKFGVPTGTGTIELKAELQGNSYPSYQAVITDENKSEIARAKNLRETNDSGTRILKWDIPARLLPPGDYSLRVSGVDANGKIEELRSYPFRVLR